MTRKHTLGIMAMALLLAILSLNSGHVAPVYAEAGTIAVTGDGDSMDVQVQITGTIQSITAQSSSVTILVLDDGTHVLINPATLGGGKLSVGQSITVTGSLDDGEEQMVAKMIVVVASTETATVPATASGTATVAATTSATVSATVAATAVATLTADCGGNGIHPVANRLAKVFNVPYAEIMNWHCQGIGFGEISKAYWLAQQTGKAPADFFAEHKAGKGWGQILKENDDSATGVATRGSSGKGDDHKKEPTKGKGNGNGKSGK